MAKQRFIIKCINARWRKEKAKKKETRKELKEEEKTKNCIPRFGFQNFDSHYLEGNQVFPLVAFLFWALALQIPMVA